MMISTYFSTSHSHLPSPSYQPPRIKQLWDQDRPEVNLNGRYCAHNHPRTIEQMDREHLSKLDECIHNLNDVISQLNPHSHLHQELFNIRLVDEYLRQQLVSKINKLLIHFRLNPSVSRKSPRSLTESRKTMEKLSDFLSSSLQSHPQPFTTIPTTTSQTQPSEVIIIEDDEKQQPHQIFAFHLSQQEKARTHTLTHSPAKKRKRQDQDSESELKVISEKKIYKGLRITSQWGQYKLVECYSKAHTAQLKVKKTKNEIVIYYPHGYHRSAMPDKKHLIKELIENTQKSIRMLNEAIENYREFQELFVELKKGIEDKYARAEQHLKKLIERRSEKKLARTQSQQTTPSSQAICKTDIAFLLTAEQHCPMEASLPEQVQGEMSEQPAALPAAEQAPKKMSLASILN